MKTNRLYFTYLIGLITFATVANAHDSYRIRGKIGNHSHDGKLISLTTFVQNDTLVASVDTTRILDGEFIFTGKENPTDYAQISFTDKAGKLIEGYVILEKGNIQVEYDDSLRIRIGGTSLNDFSQLISDSIESRQKKAYEAHLQFKEGYILQDSMLKVVLPYFPFKKQLVKDNITNIIGQRIFLYEPDEFDDDVYLDILAAAGENIKKHPKVEQELALREKKKQEEERDRAKYIANRSNPEPYSGVKIKDFKFFTPDGETKQLHDFIGKSKYLYLDFWASWCGPCIADMPELKKMYKEYKDKGLEIIGISFDYGKLSWKKGIEQIDVPWVQLSDLESYSPIRKEYDIRGIPAGLLLDENGIILADGLLTHSYLLQYIIAK